MTIYDSVLTASSAVAEAYTATAKRALSTEGVKVLPGEVADMRALVLGREVVLVDVGPTSLVTSTTARSEQHDVTLLVGAAATYSVNGYAAARDRVRVLLATIDRYVRSTEPRLSNEPGAANVEWVTVTDTDPVDLELVDGKGRAAAVVASVVCRVLVRPV